MAEASIRVRSKNEYVIEVNDAGETISFDISDTGLTSRLFRTFDTIDALTKDYEAKAKEIDERSDEPYNEYISKNQIDGAKLIESFYGDARKALDLFLGEGACRKIFGDKNYVNMFTDLIEQLEPHFKQMGVNAEKLKKTAVQKHAPNREARRVLKWTGGVSGRAGGGRRKTMRSTPDTRRRLPALNASTTRNSATRSALTA